MPDRTPPLHQLMYGLIYPAVLGTGIVLAVLRATQRNSIFEVLMDPAIQLAAASGLFFSASFVSAFYWPEEDGSVKKLRYPTVAFGLDFVEVILMFICFYFLGLFEVPKIVEPNLTGAYITLAIDVLWQFLWRAAVGLKWNKLWGARATVALVLLAGAFFGTQYGWVNAGITLGVGVFVVFYVLKDPRYADLEG